MKRLVKNRKMKNYDLARKIATENPSLSVEQIQKLLPVEFFPGTDNEINCYDAALSAWRFAHPEEHQKEVEAGIASLPHDNRDFSDAQD